MIVGTTKKSLEIMLHDSQLARLKGYGKAQYSRGTAWYPLRCDLSRALCGRISDLEIIVRFHYEDIALDLRRRSVRAAEFGTF
jgi:hypothetical protein